MVLLSVFRERAIFVQINQVYKASTGIPIEMYKDLSSFKIYMSDVGLFVNKAKYPLYQIDLSEQPVMISMGPLTEHYVANELRINGFENNIKSVPLYAVFCI